MARIIRRGHIYWYRFDQPDKKRPVLVLTRNSIIDYLGDVTVVPITSTIRNIPTEVILGQLEGLHQECAANFDHLQTIAKARLGGQIGEIGLQKLEEARHALLFAMGY